MKPLGAPSIAVALALLLGLAAPSLAQQPGGPTGVAALANLSWRAIGPANMGGRVTTIDGIPGNRTTFYVGGADGGIWKTTNGGVTFDALFTDQSVYSIGALAIAPSDHNVIWVGTGEGDPRNSASFGNGVYRSTDAGATWIHLGLDDSERIKRIVVHPRDPEIAYVCVVGHSWGPNAERGVFRTGDGGTTWDRVLYKNEDTGCSDIAMDPSNPRILYAGMWTFRRRPWHFTDGGGETALYRTTDGGESWTQLTNGLPKGPMARIGVAVAASRPSTVYMITEARDEGVLFRSDDGGATWRSVYDNPNINFRPFYYSDIRVDPTNAEVVYSLSGGLYQSKDGGRTFASIGRGIHGDHQALWIDPLDPERILSGSDGGYQVSYDGAATWKIINNVELSQFYHVFYDMQEPYFVCGGLQDNGSWCGPSRTMFREGIGKRDWYTVSGGDGFYAVPVPDRPWMIWSNSQGGTISLTDLRSWSSRDVHPYPNRVGSSGDSLAEHKYRFNWDPPIEISPHDPRTVYYGGNVVFKTTDGGYSWEVISPDLTTNDKSKQRSSGGPVYVDNTAAEFHSTILAIEESPVTPGVIWAGTDDGNIQLTRDGGESWTNLTPNVRGLPPYSWVARMEASHFDAATAYVAIDRHQENDFAPYVYKTTDFGRTWTSLRGNLPAKGYVHVVREDPMVQDLLYVGTELGVFVSWDGGRSWESLRLNVPTVAVRDIKVHPRDGDLILGTHGRGVWILDDPTPLRQLARAQTTRAHLFDVRPGVRWETTGREASLGSETYRADNPPSGALIHYYLAAVPEQGVRLTVADGEGKTVRVIRVRDAKPGVNRAVWDLRHEGPAPVPGTRDDDAGGGFNRRFGGGGPEAVPGEYVVTLTAGDARLSKPLAVRPDPRVEVTAADYRAQLVAALELRSMISGINRVIGLSEELVRQLRDVEQRLGDPERPRAQATGSNGGTNGPPADTALAAVKVTRERLEALRAELTRPAPSFSYRQYPRLREELFSLSRRVSGTAARPSEAQLLRLGELREEVRAVEARFQAERQAIEALNRMLEGYPHVVTGGR